MSSLANRITGHLYLAISIMTALSLAAVTTEVSAEDLNGKVARGKYTSPRGLFAVRIPKASNWAGVPFTIEEASEAGERNYDTVAFYVRDFGEVLLVSVRRIPPQALDEMAKDDAANVVKNLADKALSDWRQDVAEEPTILEDELVATPYGQAALRLYRVPKGSHMQGTSGGSGQETTFPDALIAIVAAKRNDHMISAIAEHDASFLEVQHKFRGLSVELSEHMEKKDREKLKERLLEFFDSVVVPKAPKFDKK
jgi:hypothetical protein